MKAMVIGGGLAGSEAAWQLAQRGVTVTLYEMRPQTSTGAHITSHLAEIVCSNSLGSYQPDRANGLLQQELKGLGSLLLDCAHKTRLPAGGALAVDRLAFSELVTQKISAHPLITLLRQEATSIPESPCIIASGPLTSAKLSEALALFTGSDHLFFFDALSPIVTHESLDHTKVFRASRYDEGQQEKGDYINCPLNQTEYETFVTELIQAQRIPLKSFEEAITQGVKAGSHHFFEGCLPVEIIASRGIKSLAFGPMSPKGITDPQTGRWPYAVVQLRQDNLAGDLYNLVGFQTNLTFSEQERVFRLIPGLEHAEFVRHGQMHRNTFIKSPQLLYPTLQSKKDPSIFFAGQLTGVEGYMGNIATGLLAGINLAHHLKQVPPLILPRETMLGALCHYISHAEAQTFQPMKANFGILPPLSPQLKISKKDKGTLYAQRAQAHLKTYLQAMPFINY